MTQISFPKLRKNLKSEKQTRMTQMLSTKGEKYLYKEIIRKLMAGKRVTYGDVDFNKFDVDDILSVSDFYDKHIETLDSMCRSIINAEPQTKPTFFV